MTKPSDITAHEATAEGVGYVCIFWWQLKFLAATSICIATVAGVLNATSFYEWTSYRNIDLALSEYFPGITNLARSAASPAAWRMYFYAMALATVFGCVRFGRISWHLSKSESEFSLPHGIMIFLLSALVLFTNIWFVFFNSKTVAISVLSRGTALLAVFHTTYIGLALSGWFFFFFVMICVVLLAKLAGSYFRS